MQNSTESYKYVPIKLLGKGSYGKAYLVESTVDKTLAVIKTIQIDLLSEQEKKVAYLETKILEKLDHPNIIKFREIFLTKPPNMTLHLVMDYADGGDLESKIKYQKKYLPESTILDWFTQICLAIKHIHDRKILHRDIKSQNIFLTGNGLIKLGDFGIAKCLSYTLEQVQTITGTPYYLSPEIVMNKPYSFKSDIWSLGVLLYEMTALKMPFTAQSLPKLSLNIIKGAYNPLPVHYSKDLKLLIGSLLQIDPSKRPTIYEILSKVIITIYNILTEYNLIKSRIKSFLSDFEYNKEFSHTILHKYNLLNTDIEGEVPKRVSKEKEKEKVVTRDSSNNLIIQAKPFALEKKKEENVQKPPFIANVNVNAHANVNYLNNNQNNHNIKMHIINHVQKKDSNNRVERLQSPPGILANNHPPMNQAEQITVTPPKTNVFQSIKNVLEKHKYIKIFSHFRKLISGNNDKLIPAKGKPGEETNTNAEVENEKNILKDFISTIHKKIKEKQEPIQDEIKDLVNAHKMLQEMSKIDNEEDSANTDTENINEKNINDPNSFNISDEYKSDRFAGDTMKNEEINPVMNNIQRNEEQDSENSDLEMMRKHLEDEMGLDLLLSVYKIMVSMIPEEQLQCNEEAIIREIKSNPGFSETQVEKSIEKIPDIWILVLKERDENKLNKISIKK